MPRSAVTIATLDINSLEAATADAIDATNDHSIDVGAVGDCSKLMIEVTHTTASEKDITVIAGDNPPAHSAGQGDLVEAFAAGDSTPVIKSIVVESARFIQDDGLIHLDIEAAMTGSIKAFLLPKG